MITIDKSKRTMLRARFGSGSDGDITYTSGAWRWTPSGGSSEVITTVAGKWTVSGANLTLNRGSFEFRSVTVPVGATLAFGDRGSDEYPVVKVSGTLSVAGTIVAALVGNQGNRAALRQTVDGDGISAADQMVRVLSMSQPGGAGSGGGSAKHIGGAGLRRGTARTASAISIGAPTPVTGNTSTGTAGSTPGNISTTGTYATLARLPGVQGFSGGSGSLNQTGSGSYGGAGGGSPTSVSGDDRNGALAGGIVQIQARVLEIGAAGSISANGEAATAGEAGIASGANLTVAGGGGGGGGGSGGMVMIQYGRLSVDDADYTQDPSNAAVLARITATGGAGGVGGAGKTRLDLAADRLSWEASTPYGLNAFRKAKTLNASSAQATNIAAYWPTLAGMNGSTVEDAVGTGTMTLQSGVTRTADVTRGQVLALDGTSDGYGSADTPALTAPFALSAWVKTSTALGNGQAGTFAALASSIGGGSSINYSYCAMSFATSSGGVRKVSVEISNGTVADTIEYTLDYADGNERYYRIVAHSTTDRRLYINGVQVAVGNGAEITDPQLNWLNIGRLARRGGLNIEAPCTCEVWGVSVYSGLPTNTTGADTYAAPLDLIAPSLRSPTAPWAFVCTTAGTSDPSEPSWPSVGGAVTDGGVTWVGVAQGSNSTNTRFSGGAGSSGGDGIRIIERVQV